MIVKGQLRNRLFLLLSEKERTLGRRIPQIEVAREIDVSEQVIGRWMKNQVRQFDADIIEKLCTYFDCEVADLLYLE
jgi:DNA-binding Xre family transcriptional regulator